MAGSGLERADETAAMAVEAAAMAVAARTRRPKRAMFFNMAASVVQSGGRGKRDHETCGQAGGSITDQAVRNGQKINPARTLGDGPSYEV
ncbi:hypothetical protein ACPPVO_08125 [Dactylosporangium sp. McL0621]|uniref:hypothetical protein n=1 Tax=Dactylosporangium sp. McL0621 TaxID=3415678 RepID=UPI003CF9569B